MAASRTIHCGSICPFRADQWLLYRIQSPVAHGARGFGRGTFHTREGELVASAAQEGLLRTGIKPRRKKPPRVDPTQ